MRVLVKGKNIILLYMIKHECFSILNTLSGYKHFRINHSKEFVRNKDNINDIETF